MRVDTPTAGFYRTQLRKGSHPVGVRIWFGPPHDPVTGEELDRSWRWQAEINGREADINRLWPSCASDPISEAEYRRLSNLQAWGEQHAPQGPQANPGRAVDLLNCPMPL